MKRDYYEKEWQIYLECLKCWEYKPLNNFSKKWWRPFWVRTWCKECDSVYGKKWREENHEHRLKVCREYYEKNREKAREYNREYRKTHKESRDRSARKYPEKRKTRRETYNYIKYNHIEKPKYCSLCWNDAKVEIHHPDYNEWNNIVFCCRKCHALIHRWDAVCPTSIDLLSIRR